jgi:hypothetical protein
MRPAGKKKRDNFPEKILKFSTCRFPKTIVFGAGSFHWRSLIAYFSRLHHWPYLSNLEPLNLRMQSVRRDNFSDVPMRTKRATSSGFVFYAFPEAFFGSTSKLVFFLQRLSRHAGNFAIRIAFDSLKAIG